MITVEGIHGFSHGGSPPLPSCGGRWGEEGVSVLGTYGIVLVWVLIIIAFGIYWHAMRISQKLNKCLSLLEKLAEGTKK